MRYVDEFRDPAAARALLAAIAREARHRWTLMEICGGQTHTLLRAGIDRLLEEQVELMHGPGCPVCVTPLEQIDRALAIARRPEVIFTSFGDMLRVPGSTTDLLAVKSAGGDVRIVYSPLDAVKLARRHPDRQVVFFAVGFETTAPANAMAVVRAAREGLDNFSVLVAHVLVPPALDALLSCPDAGIDGGGRVVVEVDRSPGQFRMLVHFHASAGLMVRVSYMRTATSTPDAAVRAATIHTAPRRPSRSAVMPAIRAPAAYPRSRQSR